MILCEQDKDYKFLQNIADKLTHKDLELVFMNDEAMQRLNYEQRGINKSTDVLSFPLKALDENFILGSVVINLDAALKQAQNLKHSLEDEIALLFLHGLLHLLGFDHEKDEGQMRAKEQELIEFFKLPKSLIIRTESF